jgi:glycerol uptake facilitator-like aquaporin
MNLWQRLLAELLGTAFLLAVVVGSGVMGERLAGGNLAIALLANSLATGAGLVALILACGPVSGAHFNPAVSLLMTLRGELPLPELAPYVLAQLLGAVAGVLAAHAMFALPLLQVSLHNRSGMHLVFSEFVATLGLLLTIVQCAKHRPRAIPLAVAAYITAAYWFTSSTSFANPAVTIARAFTDSFCGIRLQDVPGFIAGQLAAVGVIALYMKLVMPGASLQRSCRPSM